MTHYLLIFLCVIFFALAHFFNAISLFARVSGKLANRPYLSQALEKIAQIFSMGFIILFAPLLAFITESLFSTKNYLLLVTLSQSVSGILLAWIYFWRFKLLSRLNYAMFSFQSKKHFLLEIFRSFRSRIHEKSGLEGIESSTKYKYFLSGFCINIFLASGFFSAFYFASLYPEYRLTLSQLAAFIHGIGALIQGLYADPALGRTFDSAQKPEWWSAFLSYFWGKWFAFVVLTSFFFLLYLLQT